MANCCEHGECDRILTLGELKGMFDLSQIYVGGQLVSFNSGTSASWAANSGKCVTYKDITNGSYYSGSTEIKMGLSGTTPTPFYFPTTGETTDGSGFDITTGYSNVTYAYSGDNIDIKEGEGCCSAITDAVRTVDLKIVSISGTPASMSINDTVDYDCEGMANIYISGRFAKTIISSNTGNECSITSSTTPAVNVSATTLSYRYGSGEKCAISDNELTNSSSSTTTFRSKNVVISDGMEYTFNDDPYYSSGQIGKICVKVPTTRISACVETNTDEIVIADKTFDGYSGCCETEQSYFLYDNVSDAKHDMIPIDAHFSGSLVQDNFVYYYCNSSNYDSLIKNAYMSIYHDKDYSTEYSDYITIGDDTYGSWVLTTDDFQSDDYTATTREILLTFEIGCNEFYMCLQQKANRISKDISWSPCCDGGGMLSVGEKLTNC